MASDQVWADQRKLSNEWLDWYSIYPQIWRRLHARSPRGVLHAFGGGGGSTEGERRAGGTGGHSIDIEDQPDYVRRFPESFTRGDATDWSLIAQIKQKRGLFACFASPPCKWYSTAKRKDQKATQPPLIPETRLMLQALFDYWAMENVVGAKDHMSSDSTSLHGSLFGLEVARERLIGE